MRQPFGSLRAGAGGGRHSAPRRATTARRNAAAASRGEHAGSAWSCVQNHTATWHGGRPGGIDALTLEPLTACVSPVLHGSGRGGGHKASQNISCVLFRCQVAWAVLGEGVWGCPVSGWSLEQGQGAKLPRSAHVSKDVSATTSARPWAPGLRPGINSRPGARQKLVWTAQPRLWCKVRGLWGPSSGQGGGGGEGRVHKHTMDRLWDESSAGRGLYNRSKSFVRIRGRPRALGALQGPVEGFQTSTIAAAAATTAAAAPAVQRRPLAALAARVGGSTTTGSAACRHASWAGVRGCGACPGSAETSAPSASTARLAGEGSTASLAAAAADDASLLPPAPVPPGGEPGAPTLLGLGDGALVSSTWSSFLVSQGGSRRGTTGTKSSGQSLLTIAPPNVSPDSLFSGLLCLRPPSSAATARSRMWARRGARARMKVRACTPAGHRPGPAATASGRPAGCHRHGLRRVRVAARAAQHLCVAHTRQAGGAARTA
jgi:hypothetical protein